MTARAEVISELDYMRALLLLIGARPYLRCHRQNVGTVKVSDGHFFHAGPPKGAADISGIVIPHGWRIEIETKIGDAKLRKAQRAWGRMIRDAGGVHVVCNSDIALTLAENVEAAERKIKRAIREREKREC